MNFKWALDDCKAVDRQQATRSQIESGWFWNKSGMKAKVTHNQSMSGVERCDFDWSEERIF